MERSEAVAIIKTKFPTFNTRTCTTEWLVQAAIDIQSNRWWN